MGLQISLRELTSGMAWSMPSLLDTTPWSSIVLKDISGMSDLRLCLSHCISNGAVQIYLISFLGLSTVPPVAD